MRNPLEYLQDKYDDMNNQYLRVLGLSHSHAEVGNKYKLKWDKEKDQQLLKINNQIKEYRDAIEILKNINWHNKELY